jgi:hypothetical protein
VTQQGIARPLRIKQWTIRYQTKIKWSSDLAARGFRPKWGGGRPVPGWEATRVRNQTEKYFARGFNTTIALVDCSGCN